jgi:hypothetical protein
MKVIDTLENMMTQEVHYSKESRDRTSSTDSESICDQ